MTRRVLVVALALATPTAAAQAPATLVGTVRDSVGRPLAGAVISIPATVHSTVSGAAGTYRLGALPAGTLIVDVRLLGYRPVRDSVRLAAGDTVIRDFTLHLAPLLVPGVVVTAAKRSQLIEEAVTSVAVVDRSDIEKRALNRIDEAIDRAPGVQFLDGQINIRGSTGYSRGLGSRVLLLVDGVPANQGDRGGISWDLLAVDQVDHAEIVKGAGSALYGSAALGGVVNLITPDIPLGLHGHVRATAGAYADPPHEVWQFRSRTGLQAGLDATASYGSEQLRGRLSGGTRHVDGYREQDAGDHWHVAGRGQWRNRLGSSRLDVSGAVAVDDYQVPLLWCVHPGECDDRGQAYQPFKINSGVRGERTDSRKGYVSAVFERTTTAGLTWSARGSWLRTTFTDTHPSAVDSIDRSAANRLGGEVRAIAQHGTQTITVGAEVARSDVDSDIFSGADTLDVHRTHTQGEYAAYGEAETPLGPARLTLGGRIDFLAVDGGAVTAVISPRLGLVHRTRAGAWRVSVGRGFRAPTIAERFPSTVIGPFRVIPNPGLVSETAWSFELGHSATPLANVAFDAALFWTEAEDFIEPTLLDSTQIVIQFQNLVRARLRGLDASVTTAAVRGRLHTTLAYLYLDARELAHGTEPERPLNFRSKHLVTVATDFGLTSSLLVGADFRYASRVERVDLYAEDRRVPTAVLDLRAGWTAGPVAVRVRLANALNYIYNQVPRTLAPVRTLSAILTWTH